MIAGSLTGYLPILILAVLAFAFAAVSLTASSFLRPSSPNPAKLSPYECGIVPERTPQGERFPVKFYLVAMLFIIFDVEIVFVYPWAVLVRELGALGVGEMFTFLAILALGYLYLLKRRALEWE